MANPKRQEVTKHLKRMGTAYQPTPDYPISAEDMEDAKYFTDLARKNEQGTLSANEAKCVLEMFEAENPVIIDLGTERWVECDGS